MKAIHMVTFILLAVGGLNWGVYGITSLFGTARDLVGFLPGGMEGVFAAIVYIVVGLSAVAELVMHKKNCTSCGKEKGPDMNAASGMNS